MGSTLVSECPPPPPPPPSDVGYDLVFVLVRVGALYVVRAVVTGSIVIQPRATLHKNSFNHRYTMPSCHRYTCIKSLWFSYQVMHLSLELIYLIFKAIGIVLIYSQLCLS